MDLVRAGEGEVSKVISWFVPGKKPWWIELLIGKTMEETGISHSREGLFQNEGKKQSTTILALFTWTLNNNPMC